MVLPSGVRVTCTCPSVSSEIQTVPWTLAEARARVIAACKENGLAFLDGCTPENVADKIDEGVRVIAGHREDTAEIGRAHSKRTMPV